MYVTEIIIIMLFCESNQVFKGLKLKAVRQETGNNKNT